MDRSSNASYDSPVDVTDRDIHASVGAPRPQSVTPPAVLRQRVLTSGRAIHRGRVELLDSLVAVDRSGYWAVDGARTCAHWAAEQLDVSVATAREWLRIAHALAALPATNEEFRAGRLSYSKVRELTRIAADHPDLEDELIGLVSHVGIAEVGHVLADWCNRNETAGERDRRRRRTTSLSIRIGPDGMGTLTVRASAVALGRIHAAVDARVMQGVIRDDEGVPTGDRTPPERPTLAAQRAMALVDLLCNGNGSKVETEVIVHVRADGCSMHDGTPVADNVVASLLEDSFVRLLIHDADSHPINASGRHRHPYARQKRVVDERQPACVDCDGTELLEYDHDPEYEVSGRTVVDELYRRCAKCHRERHGK